MIFEHTEYREILRDAFKQRHAGGRGHSLRAQAERLGISTSFLSEVINKKKCLSVELALKIALRLGFTDVESQFFCLLVQLEQEKDPEFRKELTQRLEQISPRRPGHDLSIDEFKYISGWHHAAILELSYLPGMVVDAASVDQALGIGRAEAQAAIARLARLGLLVKRPRGWKNAHNYVFSSSTVPTKAFKDFHRGVLSRADEAVQDQDAAARMSATDVFAFDSRLLPQIDRLSQEFSASVLKIADRAREGQRLRAFDPLFSFVA